MLKPPESMDPSFYELGYLDPHTSRAMDIGDDHAGSQGTATPLPPGPTSAAGSGEKVVHQGRALRDLQDYTSRYTGSSQEPSRMESPTSDLNILLQVTSTSKRPLEAEVDGMISLIFTALMLICCLLSPEHAKTKEVGNIRDPSKTSCRKRASLEPRIYFSRFFEENLQTQRIAL